MTMKTRAAVGILWLGFAAVFAPAADPAQAPELRSYPIEFADGSNAVQVIQPLLGDAAKAAFDPLSHRLLVTATPAGHAIAAQVIRQIDVPPKNVRIDIEFNSRGQKRDAGAAVQGKAVTTTGPGGRTTVRIGGQIDDSSTGDRSTTRQQLLVTSGREAYLVVGENVPYLEWLVGYGMERGYLRAETRWQRVGARLVVAPTVIGDGPTIRVRLTPELSGLVNGSPYRTRFTDVATEVIVTDGAPFPLGGLAEKKDFYSRFLVGMDRSNQKQDLDITLTARILPSVARP